MNLKALSLSAALLAAALLPSCGIDYQTKAVERARNYALDNMKGLDESQRDFIRYTDPQIADKELLDVRERENSASSVVQTCMVWNVPGVDGSVVVVGTATRDTRDWNPVRIVVEDLESPDKDLFAARQLAVSFVMSRMLYLTDAERNRVRFSDPEQRPTSFELPKEEPKAGAKPLSRWEAYLKSKEKKVEPVQGSFVWKADAAGDRIVVCGLAKKGLKGWAPVSGMVVGSAELEGHTASGWKAPAPVAAPAPAKSESK